MSDDSHIPDEKIAAMMAQWLPLDDTHADLIDDDQSPLEPVTIASLWFGTCQSMLLPGRRIVSDYRILRMLDHASRRFELVGIDGRYYIFADGSRIVANSDGEMALPA